ncbi:hypothetical protein BHM03_00048639, partial [Ensete ventricosum]
VEFRSVFRATSQKFKILANPGLLAVGKSYEHGFAKKNSTVINITRSHEKSYEHGFAKKNSTVLNITRCHTPSRVSIGFSCTISKIQNIGHSRRISTWEAVRARFSEKIRRSQTLREVMRRVKFRSIFHAPPRKFKILAIPNVFSPWEVVRARFCKKMCR